MNMEQHIVEAKRILGHSIKARREAKGIGFLDFAKAAGITKGHLSRLERGTHNPTIETIVKICHTLDVQVSVLLKAGRN